MIEKAIKAVFEDGVRALSAQADGLEADMNRSLQTLEHYKRLAGDLVKLSAEVRESDFFSKVAALKIGELTIIGEPVPLEHVGVQIGGNRSYIEVSGFPSRSEPLSPGRYRIVLTLQKVGDL